MKCLEETQSRYCACTKLSCRILRIQNMRVVSGHRNFTLCTVKFDTTLILLKITDQWYIVSVRFRFVWNRVYLALLSLPVAGEPREESALMPIESLFLPPACLDHTNGVRSKQKWNDVYNAEKKILHCYILGKKFPTPEIWERNYWSQANPN